MQADALPLPQPHQVSLREFFLLGEAGSAPPSPTSPCSSGGTISTPPSILWAMMLNDLELALAELV